MKPVVHYQNDKDHFIEAGRGAFVFPVDHPSDRISNIKLIQTSTVQTHNKETGEFETLNTCYRPVSILLQSL